ncbi:MAG: HDOD domain-containing protein [Planctomycetes bacterium]|nr:HDOD domain-containing protein [Planctomycetota bacterium]MCB9903025.1 HDOD domain-containing protein [Planctomycetota bacterium]
MAGAYVGRQAIYDRSMKVHAYELLYRRCGESRGAEFPSGDLATAHVLSDAFLEIGAQRLAGDVPCFLNLTEGYITGDLPLPLPPERVVVEVLEDVLPTAAVVEGVERIKERGVRIALDDYVHRDGNDPLLEIAEYVKVDLRAQDRDATRALVEELRKWNVKLLAEKVETEEELNFCMDLGFDYFQGFFLNKPEIVEGHRIPSNRVGLLRILSKLLDPMVEMKSLGELISQDVSLAYKLMRHSNSTLFAPQQEITAIQHSLVLLGLRAIREIVSLIILIDLDDRPGDLVTQSLTRARMCQGLAERVGYGDPSEFFTAGLFSNLDALTRVPMERVLADLPLSERLAAALLAGEGKMGAALACVRAFERGDWDDVGFGGLDEGELSDAFADATAYSQRLFTGMAANIAA